MNANQVSRPVYLLAVLLACAPLSAAFAGSVTRVEGSLSNGSTLTITGTGFGSKTNPKPLYYWDFSVGTATSPLSRNTFSGPMAGHLASTVVAPGSSRALTNDVAGVTEAFGPGPSDGVPFSSSTLYMWVKKYYGFHLVNDSASNGLNLKFFRLWNNWTSDIYTGYQGSMGLNSGRTMPEVTSELSTWWSMPHENNRWVIDEWEYKAGDVDVTNGVFHYTRDGISAYARSTRFRTRTSGASGFYNHFFFDQISNNQLSRGKYLYFDSIYADDTWQRVVISDEPTWQVVTYGSGGTKRNREVQIPTAWSDTSIRVTVRQGGLGNLSNRYLYVIGADGSPVNQKGYALSGDSAASPEQTPMPPSDVNVQ